MNGVYTSALVSETHLRYIEVESLGRVHGAMSRGFQSGDVLGIGCREIPIVETHTQDNITDLSLHAINMFSFYSTLFFSLIEQSYLHEYIRTVLVKIS